MCHLEPALPLRSPDVGESKRSVARHISAKIARRGSQAIGVIRGLKAEKRRVAVQIRFGDEAGACASDERSPREEQRGARHGGQGTACGSGGGNDRGGGGGGDGGGGGGGEEHGFVGLTPAVPDRGRRAKEGDEAGKDAGDHISALEGSMSSHNALIIGKESERAGTRCEQVPREGRDGLPGHGHLCAILRRNHPRPVLGD